MPSARCSTSRFRLQRRCSEVRRPPYPTPILRFGWSHSREEQRHEQTTNNGIGPNVPRHPVSRSHRMNWDKDLYGPARTIAETPARRLRVKAGPGTGKSFALKRRIARLLEQGQDPSRVLVVTFTRNAAASLINDLDDLSVPGRQQIDVGTLHSFCFRLLQRADVFEYLERVPRPLISISKSGSLQFEGGVMLNDLAHDGTFGDKRARAKRVKAFEAAWARLQSEQPGWSPDPVDERFERHLISWLKFHRAMLIDELVPQALRYLRDNPTSYALRAYDHVVVDEYQDLNRAEQEIIDLLAHSGSTAIVGDADQSIYRFFRYANPDGIDDYSARHPLTHDQSLIECRRCPKRVVAVANRLIQKNYPPASPPRLTATGTNREGEIHAVQWGDANAEAEGIAAFVRHLLDHRGFNPNDMMVITPRRKLAYGIRDAMNQEQIPVHSFYQEEALEEAAAQKAYALLTLLTDEDDRVALRWWLGKDSSNGRTPSFLRLRRHCEETGDSPRQALESILQGTLSLPRTAPLRHPFSELVEDLSRLHGLSLAELVDVLMPPNDDSCAALREIALLAIETSSNSYQLLDQIKTHITQPEVPEGRFVRIMSPQKAKGLTCKVVIVTGCCEGLLPVRDDSLSPQEQRDLLREQRRLFYVAITRCTHVLTLSSFSSIEGGLARKIGVTVIGPYRRVIETIASRFIAELGPMAPQTRTGSVWQSSGYREA